MFSPFFNCCALHLAFYIRRRFRHETSIGIQQKCMVKWIRNSFTEKQCHTFAVFLLRITGTFKNTSAFVVQFPQKRELPFVTKKRASAFCLSVKPLVHARLIIGIHFLLLCFSDVLIVFWWVTRQNLAVHMIDLINFWTFCTTKERKKLSP